MSNLPQAKDFPALPTGYWFRLSDPVVDPVRVELLFDLSVRYRGDNGAVYDSHVSQGVRLETLAGEADRLARLARAHADERQLRLDVAELNAALRERGHR